MDSLDPTARQLIGGCLLLVVAFVIREFAAGALRKAGEEFWAWVRSGPRRAGQMTADPPEDRAVVERPLRLLPPGPNTTDGTAPERSPGRSTTARSHRKSA